MKQLNKKKAFTLVEVLIVLVILGILTVAVVMGVNWSTDRARESGVQSTLHSYELAANKVGVQLAGYDNVSLDELVKLLNKSLDQELKLSISNDVIVSDAVDPWGNTIKVGFSKPNETNGQLKFTSAGPNGIVGDNDDIVVSLTHTNRNGKGDVIVDHPVADHTHDYSAQVQSPRYLVTPGTCTIPAKYYVSCSCGDVGYATFNGDVDPTNHTNVSTTYVELNDTHHTKKEFCSACNVEFTSQEELHVGETECTLCGAIIHTHNYDQQVATSTYQYLPASCISKAKYYYSCSCGAKGTETFEHGELAAHSYTLTNTAATGAKVSDATCTSKAVYYKSCVGCGALGTETFESGDVDLTNHVGNNRTEYTNLNATQHLKKVTCDACNTIKSSTNENHTMNAQNTCTLCNAHTHNFNQQVVASNYLKSAATCTSKAVYYKSCTCGEKGTTTFESGTTTAHNMTNTVNSTYLKSAANCISKAVYYRSCSYCGLKDTVTFENGNVDTMNHVGNASTTYESLNANQHTKKVTCDSCHTTKSTTTENHTMNAQNTCTLCGNHVHNFSRKDTSSTYLYRAADCTNKAIYYYSCVCGLKGTETFNYGSTTAHNYAAETATDTYLKSVATCTAKAVYYKSCTGCGAKGTTTFEVGTFNASNHSKTTKVKATTASVCWKWECCGAAYDTTHVMVNTGTAGVHQTCSDCGYKTTTHTYNVDSGVQYTAATCTAARKNYQKCSCGYNPQSASYVVSTGSVNSSNHTGTSTYGGTAGVHTKYTCCGATISSSHTYDQNSGVKYSDATCTVKQKNYKSCICGYNPKNASYVVEVGSVNSSNHTGTSTYGGTASVHTKYTCCGATISGSHTYDQNSGVKYSDATCTAKQRNYKSCVCGYNPKSTSYLVEVGSVNSSNHTGTSTYGGTSGVHTKYTCCGATISTTHTYDQNSGVKYSDATCTAKQKNYKSCVCGYNPKSTSYLIEVGSVNSSNHTGTSTYGGTSGVHTKYSCCGATISTSHSYTVDSGVQYTAATCIAARQNYKRCACGYNPQSSSYVVSTGSVNSGNHAGSSTYGGTSSVHTKYSCCGATISSSHTYDTDSGVKYSDATCIAKQKNYKRCACGYNPKSASYVVETGSVNSNNHVGGTYYSYTNLNATQHTKYTKCNSCQASLSSVNENHTLNAQNTCTLCNNHTHSYTQQVVSSTYLKSNATCTTKAVYYYSCVCGGKGTTTFESGNALGHSWTNACDTTCNRDSSHTRTITHTYSYTCDTSCNVCGATRTASHNMQQTKAATCTATGTKTCSYGCGTTQTITALGHSWTYTCSTSCARGCGTTRYASHNYQQTKAATCTATGTKTCSYGCRSTQTIAALGHTGGTANCTTKAVCTRCNTSYGSVDSTKHNYGSATCTSAATCTRCGATSGSAIGHLWAYTCSTTCGRSGCGATRSASHNYQQTKAATCTATGTKTCSYGCGSTQTIAKHSCTWSYTCDTTCNCCGCTRSASHNYQQTKAATCTTTGTKTCSYGCGSTQTIAKHSCTWSYTCDTTCNCCGCTRSASHSMVNVGTAAVHQRCNYGCGYQTTTHSYTVDSGVQYTAATCTAARKNYKRCSCGYNPQSSSYVVSTGSALGHNVSSPSFSWTQGTSSCTAKASGTCTRCSATVTATANVSSHMNESAATCTSQQKWDCSATISGKVNGTTWATASGRCPTWHYGTAALGHSYKSTYKAGSNATYCTRKCSRCSTYGVSTTPHIWSTTTAATCTSTGTSTCSNCSQTKSIAKNSSNHTGSFVYGGTSAVHTKYSCCGATFSASHNYNQDSGVQYSAATCTAKQKNYKSCICGYNPKSTSYLIEVGSALGHFTTDVYYVEWGDDCLTATAEGTCDRCGVDFTQTVSSTKNATRSSTCTVGAWYDYSATFSQFDDFSETCPDCHYTGQAALGHSYTNAYKAGSNATYCTKQCSRCSAYGVSSTTHSWSTTKAATCTATGTSTCSRCSQTKSIASLGHKYTSKSTTSTYLKSSATCTSAAVYYYKCSRCTAKGTSTYTSGNALGHTGYSGKYPSCTRSVNCTRCGGVVYAKLNCGANGNNNNYTNIHIEDDGILFWHECHVFDVCCNSDGTTTCWRYIRKTGKMSYCNNKTVSADRHLQPSEVPGLPSNWKDMDY